MILEAGRSRLVLVDLQERLVPAIAHGAAVVAAAGRLLSGARLLGVPVTVTEHCPEAIGPTLPELRERLAPFEIVTKRRFAAADVLPPLDLAVIAGTEAHVCVLQTALALQAAGGAVAVVEDAVGSRRESDRLAALARLRSAGVAVVTVEMVLFEWLGHADHPAFRQILALLKG